MAEKKISIAIDGPAAAGKSTVAKIAAEKLHYIYVDTGAMYRALTYKALKDKIDIYNEKNLAQLLQQTTIALRPSSDGQLVFVDGQDVTARNSQFRCNEMPFLSLQLMDLIREDMVLRQQELGENGGVVMDGRDIGTAVLPQAELKIFLLASVDIRAERRHQENTRNGWPSDLAKLKEEIKLRDQLDTEREISPLRKGGRCCWKSIHPHFQLKKLQLKYWL